MLYRLLYPNQFAFSLIGAFEVASSCSWILSDGVDERSCSCFPVLKCKQSNDATYWSNYHQMLILFMIINGGGGGGGAR